MSHRPIFLKSIGLSFPHKVCFQDFTSIIHPTARIAIIGTGAVGGYAGAHMARAGEDVTFEQVLADPDNIDLNFRYAETQIRKGDVRGASATLERILLIEPDLPRVRLLYAIVQFRLENLAEAERELVRATKMEDGNSSVHWEHLAAILDARGDWSGERRELRDLLRTSWRITRG